MGNTILIHVKSCSIQRRVVFAENLRRYLGRSPEQAGYPLVVYAAGSARWGVGTALEWGAADSCSVELITMGNTALRGSGSARVVGPGDVYLLHAGSGTRYATGPAGRLHKRFVVIGGPALGPVLRSTGLHAATTLRPDNPQEIAGIMRAAARLLDDRPDDWELGLSMLA